MNSYPSLLGTHNAAVVVKDYYYVFGRQWVIKEFELWENELEYVNQLIVDDLRNNSAWNQRYFVINTTTTFTDEVISREIE